MKYKGVAATALFVSIGLQIGVQNVTAATDQTHTIDQQLTYCLAKTTSAGAKIDCYDDAIDEWEDEIERLYELIEDRIGAVDRQGKKLFKQEHTHWLSYRDTYHKELDRSCRGKSCAEQSYMQAYQFERKRYDDLWRQLDCKACFEPYEP